MGLLKIEQVSMDDHFFNDLGANSLLMARFCAQIRERLNYSDVSMREVYLHPTPRDFASFLTTQAAQEITRCPDRAGPCGQRCGVLAVRRPAN